MRTDRVEVSLSLSNARKLKISLNASHSDCASLSVEDFSLGTIIYIVVRSLEGSNRAESDQNFLKFINLFIWSTEMGKLICGKTYR